MIRRALIAVALLAVLAMNNPAQAQWGCGLGGYGMNYYGYGMPVGWYTGVQGRMPPYFALHPPVYYSGQIIRIPYGASPFACPPAFCPGMTVEAAPAEVDELPAPEGVNLKPMAELTAIENPFYKRDAARTAKKMPVEQGQMIANPFFPGKKLAAAR